MKVPSRSLRFAVVEWTPGDGIALEIRNSLKELGHNSVPFSSDASIPSDVDAVFSFAPYGRLLQIARQLARMPSDVRPAFVHWNTENPPDLRIPWPLMRNVCAWRSWIDRWQDADSAAVRATAGRFPFSWINSRLFRFRYLGDYLYSHHHNLLTLLVETSDIYTAFYRMHGLPAVTVPWGTARDWYADLRLPRDIDVLWMGKRRNKRRGMLLDKLRRELTGSGANVYVADGVENPFIFGEARTKILNRAKITLNLLTTWYDNVFPARFHIAAGNKCLVVSEPMLPHCPVYKEGTDYVSARVQDLTGTILRLLGSNDERAGIAENAYLLATQRLTLTNSIQQIVDALVHAKDDARKTPSPTFVS